MTEIIGRCIGETSPDKVSFISKEVPSVNDYVYLEYAGKQIIGIIDSLFRGSFTLGEDLLSQDTIEKILSIEGDVDHYVRGSITILGDIEELKIPRIPAPPGTEVKKANITQLKKLFGQKGIKIGSILSQPEVEVNLNVNKMISRHLGILAMTGAGKSNATSVIIDELLKLNGTILVFDMHSEYMKTEFSKGEKHEIKPLINPRNLNIFEFKKLCRIPDSATNQERILREAYDYAKEKDMNGEKSEFLEDMVRLARDKAVLYETEEKNKSLSEAAKQTEFKIGDMKKRYGSILNTTDTDDIINQIETGKVNIIPLAARDEISMDVVVKHVLNEILRRRKNKITKSDGKKLDFPIFCIIEEAHILASQKRDTQSKTVISRIAREGRKFGVGLCLVSQSPKSLDSESLSQLNNLIILRLVEPSDQAHVQKSSESLSEELLKKLPSLNVGEAVVLGQMTKVPTMVKIDEFKGRIVGEDLDIVGEWAKNKKEKEEKINNQKKELEMMGL